MCHVIEYISSCCLSLVAHLPVPKETLLELGEPRFPLLWATSFGFSNWIFLKLLGVGYDDGSDVNPTRIPHSFERLWGHSNVYAK